MVGDPHTDPNAQGDAFKTLFVGRIVSSSSYQLNVLSQNSWLFCPIVVKFRNLVPCNCFSIFLNFFISIYCYANFYPVVLNPAGTPSHMFFILSFQVNTMCRSSDLDFCDWWFFQNFDTSESKLRREMELYGPIKRVSTAKNTTTALFIRTTNSSK